MYTQCFKNTRKLEQYKGLKIKDSMEVEYTQKGQFDKHMLCSLRVLVNRGMLIRLCTKVFHSWDLVGSRGKLLVSYEGVVMKLLR